MTSPSPILASTSLTRRDWAWAALASVLSMLLCVLFANRSGFWLDEWYTLGAARLPWSEIFAERRVNGHTPLHFYYCRLFYLLSDNQVWLRFSSALMIGASLLLATGLAGALGLRRILPGLWVLGVLHPYLLSVGLEFRYMSALVAFALACAWLAVSYSQGWSPRKGLALLLLGTVFLWLHASVLLIGAVLALFLAWESSEQEPDPRRRGLWRPGHWLRAWPMVLAVLFSLPLLFIIRDNRGLAEPQPLDLKMVLEDVCQLTLGDHLLWPRGLDFDSDYALIALTIVLVGIFALGLLALRGAELARARRLLMAWLFVAPLLFLIYSAIILSLQGPARYLCTLSAATLFMMALAWHYPFARAWQRFGWRTLMLAMVLVQAAGTLLDRGDYQREAIQWILAQQPADAPIFANSYPKNRLAFEYFGINDIDRVAGVPDIGTLSGEQDLPAEEIARRIQTHAAAVPRIFFLNYHHKGEQSKAVQMLIDQGYIKAVRLFRPTWWTIVVVAITREEERPWLDALQGPATPWGPARGHKKFNPAFERPQKVARY